MKPHVLQAIDARQTREWSVYLKSLGWEVETIGTLQVAAIRLTPFKRSFIKILHPIGPMPFAEIEDISRRYNSILTVIEPHIYKYDESSFPYNGYVRGHIFHSHSATIKIDLSCNEKSLFRSFSENARRNIKKSQTFHLDIRAIPMNETSNWKYFDIFYELLKNLGKMKRFYIPSKEEYKNKMKAFARTSVLFFAYEDDIPIAVVWYASFRNVFAYFQTGITKRGYDTLANYLLVWEGLRYAQKKKLTVFDFESIFDERFPKQFVRYKKYTEFKKRFHGDIIYYPRPWVKIYDVWGLFFHTLSMLS